MGKCSHYTWGGRNTWIADQYALVFLLTYDGDNAPVRRLQMRVMNYFVDVVHRNAHFMTPADYLSRYVGDLWWDPLISEYNAYAETLCKKHPALNGPFTSDMMLGHRRGRGWSNVKEHRSVQ